MGVMYAGVSEVGTMSGPGIGGYGCHNFGSGRAPLDQPHSPHDAARMK